MIAIKNVKKIFQKNFKFLEQNPPSARMKTSQNHNKTQSAPESETQEQQKGPAKSGAFG